MIARHIQKQPFYRKYVKELFEIAGCGFQSITAGSISELSRAFPRPTSRRCAVAWCVLKDFTGRPGTKVLPLTLTEESTLVNHEDLTRDAEIEGASNRSFGMVFTVFFAIVGIWPLLSGRGVRTWSVGNRRCSPIGHRCLPEMVRYSESTLDKIRTADGQNREPGCDGCAFLRVITPFGIGMRIFRKDPLRLRFDANLLATGSSGRRLAPTQNP